MRIRSPGSAASTAAWIVSWSSGTLIVLPSLLSPSPSADPPSSSSPPQAARARAPASSTANRRRVVGMGFSLGSAANDDRPDHASVGGAVDRAVVAVYASFVEGVRIGGARLEILDLDAPVVAVDVEDVVFVATLVGPDDFRAGGHFDVLGPERVVEGGDLGGVGGDDHDVVGPRPGGGAAPGPEAPARLR